MLVQDGRKLPVSELEGLGAVIPKSELSQTQIVGILKDAESGVPGAVEVVAANQAVYICSLARLGHKPLYLFCTCPGPFDRIDRIDTTSFTVSC